MGLFDIFRKKKTDSTFPENELEKTLLQAVSNASARNAFYKKLLWTELFVLTSGHHASEEGYSVLEKDTTVQFFTFENGQIPVFTSTNRIFDKGIIKDQVPFMAFKGQDLFSFTKGATFILNPYSDYGKELIPNEIESLLDGSIFNRTNEIIIEKDTQVQIGQPANYPVELVNRLINLFKGKDNVKAAYLAAIRMGNSNELPHILIALDVEGNMSSIINEAGPLTEQHLDHKEIVDFIQIDNKGGISDYFLQQSKPFYKRK